MACAIPNPEKKHTNMTRKEACRILRVRGGVDLDKVLQNYTDLCRKLYKRVLQSDSCATEELRKISVAYAVVVGKGDKVGEMTTDQMLGLFEDLVFERRLGSAHGMTALSSSSSGSSEESDGDESPGKDASKDRTSQTGNLKSYVANYSSIFVRYVSMMEVCYSILANWEIPGSFNIIRKRRRKKDEDAEENSRNEETSATVESVYHIANQTGGVRNRGRSRWRTPDELDFLVEPTMSDTDEDDTETETTNVVPSASAGDKKERETASQGPGPKESDKNKGAHSQKQSDPGGAAQASATAEEERKTASHGFESKESDRNKGAYSQRRFARHRGAAEAHAIVQQKWRTASQGPGPKESDKNKGAYSQKQSGPKGAAQACTTAKEERKTASQGPESKESDKYKGAYSQKQSDPGGAAQACATAEEERMTTLWGAGSKEIDEEGTFYRKQFDCPGGTAQTYTTVPQERISGAAQVSPSSEEDEIIVPWGYKSKGSNKKKGPCSQKQSGQPKATAQASATAEEKWKAVSQGSGSRRKKKNKGAYSQKQSDHPKGAAQACTTAEQKRMTASHGSESKRKKKKKKPYIQQQTGPRGAAQASATAEEKKKTSSRKSGSKYKYKNKGANCQNRSDCPVGAVQVWTYFEWERKTASQESGPKESDKNKGAYSQKQSDPGGAAQASATAEEEIGEAQRRPGSNESDDGKPASMQTQSTSGGAVQASPTAEDKEASQDPEPREENVNKGAHSQTQSDPEGAAQACTSAEEGQEDGEDEDVCGQMEQDADMNLPWRFPCDSNSNYSLRLPVRRNQNPRMENWVDEFLCHEAHRFHEVGVVPEHLTVQAKMRRKRLEREQQKKDGNSSEEQQILGAEMPAQPSPMVDTVLQSGVTFGRTETKLDDDVTPKQPPTCRGWNTLDPLLTMTLHLLNPTLQFGNCDCPSCCESEIRYQLTIVVEMDEDDDEEASVKRPSASRAVAPKERPEQKRKNAIGKENGGIVSMNKPLPERVEACRENPAVARFRARLRPELRGRIHEEAKNGPEELPLAPGAPTEVKLTSEEGNVFLDAILERGNQIADAGNFELVIMWYSKVMKHDSSNFKLGEHLFMLRDTFVSMDVEKEKSGEVFLRGKTFRAVQAFDNVEEVFRNALRADPFCKDWMTYIVNARILKLMWYGYERVPCETAFRKCRGIQAALRILFRKKESRFSLGDELRDACGGDVAAYLLRRQMQRDLLRCRRCPALKTRIDPSRPCRRTYSRRSRK